MTPGLLLLTKREAAIQYRLFYALPRRRPCVPPLVTLDEYTVWALSFVATLNFRRGLPELKIVIVHFEYFCFERPVAAGEELQLAWQLVLFWYYLGNYR